MPLLDPPPLAAVTLPFLAEIVALLAISVATVYLCTRLRLVPIVGFLLAGVVIGPEALGLVEDQELIDGMAEVGVMLLLFTIGVEFSLEKLARIRRFIFVGGGLQTAITTSVVALIAVTFGVAWQAAVFTGFLVALSSTAIVLSLLAERGETDAPSGQLSLAILIFQDLAIVLMVLLVPLLGGTEGTPLEAVLALGGALLVIAAAIVLARKAVPWILERVVRTRRQELFLLTVVAICFGTAWATSLAGVSLALGAFLAGLVVSESRYSAWALSEVLPLRTLFNAVFFVAVGMLLDVGFLVQNLPVVLAVAGGVLLLKALITTGSVLVLGYPLRIASAVGLGLAQIGEFSFVLERAGRTSGLSPAGLGEAGEQTFIAVTVLLMILTPFLLQLGPRLGGRLERSRLGRVGRQSMPQAAETEAHPEDHVVVVGYGPAGQRLAQVLKETGIPLTVVELNPHLADAAREASLIVLNGDASRAHVLEEAGIERAKLCVVVINDRAAARRVVELAHYLNPTLQIVVRTRPLSDVEAFQRAGADVVVPEELETSVRIFRHVLEAYLVPEEEIQRQTDTIRAGDYRVFRSSIQEAHLMVLQGLDAEGLHTRAVVVREGAPAAGQTLAELALRQRYRLTVLTVRRGRQTFGNPQGDFRLEVGDRLVLIGSADDFIASAALFRERVPEGEPEPEPAAEVEAR